MNILFRVISPINIFDIGFLQKCLQLIIFWFELLFIWLHFPTFSTAAAYFFFNELKITKYFANMPDFIMSENNPINNLGRCQQMLWEVYKRVEWFLKRIFGEFLHSNLLKQSFIKTQDNSSDGHIGMSETTVKMGQKSSETKNTQEKGKFCSQLFYSVVPYCRVNKECQQHFAQKM